MPNQTPRKPSPDPWLSRACYKSKYRPFCDKSPFRIQSSFSEQLPCEISTSARDATDLKRGELACRNEYLCTTIGKLPRRKIIAPSRPIAFFVAYPALLGLFLQSKPHSQPLVCSLLHKAYPSFLTPVSTATISRYNSWMSIGIQDRRI